MEFLSHYWGYILIFAMFILSSFVHSRIKNTYQIYSSNAIESGYTGKQAAEAILNRNGINDVGIYSIEGTLTDSYSQKHKVISLSNQNYNESSIATVAVAAHEAGHAIQVKERYNLMTFLVVLKPLVRIATSLFFPLVFFGAIANVAIGTNVLFYLFAAVFLLQMLMLPVEFNASRRALEELSSANILNEEELYGAKKMLNAAAMSYVAAALMTFAFMARAKKK